MADQTAPLETRFTVEQLEATADAALSVLAALGPQAPDLVDAWIQRGNAASVAAAAEQASGAARKAARRGLNVLKARGVAIPERRRVAKFARNEGEETCDAWLLAPDSVGNVLLVLAARSRTSRYFTASIVLNDSIGLQQVNVAELSRSQLKDALLRALPDAEYKAVAVNVPWVRWRVAQARKRNTELGLPEPLGVGNAARLLEPVPDAAPPHPIDEEGLALSDEDARELARSSGRLHGWPEFRSWFPPRRAVNEMMLEVGATLTPGQEPDQEDLQRTIDRAICTATDRHFSPEVRDVLVAQMRDSALSVLQRAGEQPALEVVAATQTISAAGLITDPPHQIPFLRAFFDKAVAVMVAQGGGQLRIPVPRRPDAATTTSDADGTPET